MSLHDPATFAAIVRGMVDIQKHEGTCRLSTLPRNKYDTHSGWLPECRGATAMHFIQGGSSMSYAWSLMNESLLCLSIDADPILGEFFVK